MEESDVPTRKTPRVVPLSHGERVEAFGSFTFRANPTRENPERVLIDRSWENKNLVKVEVPQLQRQQVRLHVRVVEPFLGLFAAWERAGLAAKVLTFDGAYAHRFKRFTGTAEERMKKALTANAYDLSNHAWGSAFDINAGWNRLGRVPAEHHEVGTVRPLVAIAYELGWVWGGHFRSRPDGMHFEYAGVEPALEVMG